jgi:hypothetical protein
LTTFDPTCALWGLAALGGMAFWIVRHQPNELSSLWQQRQTTLAMALFLWSGMAFVGLGSFYLYHPIIESRFLLDFAPAFTGLVAGAWVAIPLSWHRFLWPLLGGWLLFEIVTAKVAVQAPPLAKGMASESALPHASNPSLRESGGIYTLAHPASDSGIQWNGHGWAQNGFADDVVILLVDKPKYVELQMDSRESSNGKRARNDDYQAMIDGISLPLRKVIPNDYGWQVRFDVPPELQKSPDDEILFLCFSEGYDAEDRDSDRMLYSVRWR